MRRVIAKPRFTRMPHRCVKCEARRTLPKLWSDYERPPRCRQCGYYRLYPCRDRLASRWGRVHACNCGGYWFTHRKGSKFCYENPRYEQNVTERWEERNGVYDPVSVVSEEDTKEIAA